MSVPAGGPAAISDTSKLMALIEGLTASAASKASPTPDHVPAPAEGGPVPGPTGGPAARASASGTKGAPVTPALSKAEQVSTSVSDREMDVLIVAPHVRHFFTRDSDTERKREPCVVWFDACQQCRNIMVLRCACMMCCSC